MEENIKLFLAALAIICFLVLIGSVLKESKKSEPDILRYEVVQDENGKLYLREKEQTK